MDMPDSMDMKGNGMDMNKQEMEGMTRIRSQV